MSSSSHTYFSNHSHPRLPSNSSITTTTTAVAPVGSGAGAGGNSTTTSGHSSLASSLVLNGSGGVDGARPRSHSKHFSLSVGGNGTSDKDRGTSGSNGGSGQGGAPAVHPLKSTWVFWFRQQRHPGNKITNYEEGIKKITAFSSVESFWSLWTHLSPPTTLQPTTDYLLFHADVRRPVWEDPLNIDGGKWIVRLRKGVADRLWEDLVLGTIGDQFEEEDGVCGCALSVRAQEDIISVWHKDEKDTVAKGRIKETIRRCLNLPANTNMEYKTNNDSLQDKSSFRTTIDRSNSTTTATTATA